MKKRKVSLPFILGAVLILVSLCFVLVFQYRMYAGTRKSQLVVSKLGEMLPERVPGVPGMYLDSGVPVLEIDGIDYVAMLEIPLLGFKLPVADNWDADKLTESTARFYGSAYDQTLVIAGVDYPKQFGFCDKIEHGTKVVVTDMTGAQFAYTVSRIDRAQNAENQWLLHEDYDLTLFAGICIRWNMLQSGAFLPMNNTPPF